jgi:hypothetical protein
MTRWDRKRSFSLFVRYLIESLSFLLNLYYLPRNRLARRSKIFSQSWSFQIFTFGVLSSSSLPVSRTDALLSVSDEQSGSFDAKRLLMSGADERLSWSLGPAWTVWF